ncbi:nucleotide disphospho-sugar-binding domain-containing protein [Micromonospora sp. LOL_015]|uniref:nucleotide disphospho-sugar-binding domain-containing protein n=1 Tax=Micromonospora sp. LOL_015 TaxID=3345416 RepID=UPI003A8C10F3
MRVLFTTWAWPSHLYGMVPLAWACQAAGHDVVVASQPTLQRTIAATGLTGVSVGADRDAETMVRGYLLPAAAERGRSEPVSPRTGRGPRALQMFLAHADAMLDELVEVARQWSPNLIVYEPTAWAGPLAAQVVKVPAVRHLYGADLLVRARQLLPELLAPLARRHGSAPVDPTAAPTIDPWPARLRLPGSRADLPMRHVPFNGPWQSLPPNTGSADRSASRASRRRICVSWGHTIARVSPSRFIAGAVAKALAAHAEVILAVSADQHELLGPLPDGVRVLHDVPLRTILPGCDLLVSHGGAGSILTALDAGVPMLLVPQLPDHAAHAAAVLGAGCGAVLNRAEATPEQLRREAGSLLTDKAVADAVHEVRRDMHAQPGPAQLVPRLEQLALDRV